MVEVRDSELATWKVREFITVAEKRKDGYIYIVYNGNYDCLTNWKFCRKISEEKIKQIELKTQINELKEKIKEIEIKIKKL